MVAQEQPELLPALEYPPMSSTLQTLRVMMGDAYRACSQAALAQATYKEFEWALAVRMWGGGVAAAVCLGSEEGTLARGR